MTWKLLLCAAALCAACGTEDDTTASAGPGGQNGDAGLGGLAVDAGRDSGAGNNLGGSTGCGLIDLLFVIDNSGSMTEEQENLAQNFPRVISVLDALKGGGVQYRIGVTTTSIGAATLAFLPSSSENGALLQTPDMQHPWLERGEPDLAARFTRLATVGTGGSGNEQPLRAARAAVTDREADQANAGFRRTNALLAVVILTDEDDTSAEEGMPIFGVVNLPGAEIPVADFVTSFDSVAGSRGNWATAVIAGDQQGGCESAFGEANYAGRLVEFVQQTGKNAVLGSICTGDLAGELDKALNVFTNACETFVPLF